MMLCLWQAVHHSVLISVSKCWDGTGCPCWVIEVQLCFRFAGSLAEVNVQMSMIICSSNFSSFQLYLNIGWGGVKILCSAFITDRGIFNIAFLNILVFFRNNYFYLHTIKEQKKNCLTKQEMDIESYHNNGLRACRPRRKDTPKPDWSMRANWKRYLWSDETKLGFCLCVK